MQRSVGLRSAGLAFGLALVLLGSGTAVADAGTPAPAGAAAVAVTGAVTTPTTYTRAALAALPQTTVPVTARGFGGHMVTGVGVEDLVQAAGPAVDPAVKNGLLRVRVTATDGSGRRVTTTLGELDPSFGDHPALLVLAVDGRPTSRVGFGFPGDATVVRALTDVRTLTVAVAAAPDPLPTVAAGAVVVDGPRGPVTLAASTLRRLPTQTVTVTYRAGTAVQTHSETGPQLAFVLLAAGVVPTLATAVTGVGADGYLATVAAGESVSGARTLLLSLVEDGQPLARPRLVPAGDVKGGRYVSDVVELAVTR